MTATSKLVWLEGMFVRPQHFQQFDRWVEAEIERRATGLTPFPWGIRRLEIESASLKLGQIKIVALEAVLPDGTFIAIPDGALPPPVRTIPNATANALVKLALPVRRLELGDYSDLGQIDADKRFRTFDRATRNATAPQRETIDIRVAQLQTAIIVEGEPEQDRVTLPIARIQEISSTGEILLSESYIPPTLSIGASRAFQTMLRETQVLLKSRGDAIAKRLDPARIGADAVGIMDMMTLSVVNGREALIAHYATVQDLHPEVVYRTFVDLVGALSSFDARKRRPGTFPSYRHDDIEASFSAIVVALRDLLTVVYEEKAVAIPLQKRGVGVWVGTVNDRRLFDGATFVLVASASVQSEMLRAQLPVQTKVSPVETIRELVNLQLPGIPMKVLPVAPREIPFMRNAVYFELERNGDLWQRMPQSAAFAIHSSGDYPDLNFELWAVRSE